MAEVKQDVKMVKVDFSCPECESGYLRPSGTVLTTYPPMFPHMCDNPQCNYGQTFNHNYPIITHEPIESGVLSEDEILQRIVDAINYNNLCAKATLGDVPKITIEDIRGELFCETVKRNEKSK